MRLTEDVVLKALARHIGECNSIHSGDLVFEITGRKSEADMRTLRDIIVDLRMQGLHICGHPGTGYYMAATSQELDRTCLFLHDRSMTSLMQISAMKNVSLPDLKGQLHLPT